MIDEIVRGQVSTPMENLDQFVTGEITNHLFENVKIPHSGQDLPALNIQRGKSKKTFSSKIKIVTLIKINRRSGSRCTVVQHIQSEMRSSAGEQLGRFIQGIVTRSYRTVQNNIRQSGRYRFIPGRSERISRKRWPGGTDFCVHHRFTI